MEGLLWYDSDPKRGLADKVLRAAERHREKRGDWPNVCYVHHSALLEGSNETRVQRNGCDIRVLSAPNILLHHFWLGVVDREQWERG